MGYKMAADGLHCEGMLFILNSMLLFSGLNNKVKDIETADHLSCQNFHFSLINYIYQNV